MDNIIERYVYAVTRRLPEKEREEVRRELTANICDMLPDDPGNEEISAVLYELGEPAKLAEKYRQNPRYLISPALYDYYIRAIKLVLPIVGAVLFIVGVALGTVDSMKSGADLAGFISNVMSNGISLSLSAVVQVLVWTTIGFVIAERAGAAAEFKTKEKWKLEDLPEAKADIKYKIPLSDSIAEIALTAVFAAAAICVCTGTIPVGFYLSFENIAVYNIFSPEFLSVCLPAVVILAVFDIADSIIKLVHSRWSALTCASTFVSRLINCGIMLYLLTRPFMLSENFTEFLLSDATGVPWLAKYIENAVINPAAALFAAGIIAGTIFSCVRAVIKTVKARAG